MPNFKVLCRVETVVDTVAVVSGETALEAVERAHDGPLAHEWVRINEDEVAVRYYVALDEAGSEIESTRMEDI